MTSFDEFAKEMLRDPNARCEYERLRPIYKSISEGIEQSLRGETVDLGSFAEYTDEP